MFIKIRDKINNNSKLLYKNIVIIYLDKFLYLKINMNLYNNNIWPYIVTNLNAAYYGPIIEGNDGIQFDNFCIIA